MGGKKHLKRPHFCVFAAITERSELLTPGLYALIRYIFLYGKKNGTADSTLYAHQG